MGRRATDGIGGITAGPEACSTGAGGGEGREVLWTVEGTGARNCRP